MATILVIEDEPNLCLLCRETLEEAGYEVVTTASGRHALKIIQTQLIDLVVLDLRLPDVDGIELLGLILNDCRNVPLIVYTAYSSHKLDFRCWGADAYVCKSSDLSELTTTVREFLGN